MAGGRPPSIAVGFFVVSASPEQLGANLEAALEWLGAYFVNESPLQKAAEQIARRMDELGIDYAIAGALSLAAHGLVRGTADVDVLLSSAPQCEASSQSSGPARSTKGTAIRSLGSEERHEVGCRDRLEQVPVRNRFQKRPCPIGVGAATEKDDLLLEPGAFARDSLVDV